MSLTASSKSESNFDPMPEGTHQMVCFGVVDEGKQYSKKWDKENYKIRVFWECPDERIDIEKDGVTKNLPRVISKEYTLSIHPKSNLSQDLVAWRGKQFTPEELEGFDLSDLIGANCLIQIVHNFIGDKTYANIASISRLMKNMDKKDPESATFVYDIQRDGINIPKEVYPWVRKIIEASPEYNMVLKHQGGIQVPQAVPDTEWTVPDTAVENVAGTMADDDIPF